MHAAFQEELETFEEVFNLACPKFVNAAVPDLDNPATFEKQEKNHQRQLKLFLEEVKQQQPLPRISAALNKKESSGLSPVSSADSGCKSCSSTFSMSFVSVCGLCLWCSLSLSIHISYCVLPCCCSKKKSKTGRPGSEGTQFTSTECQWWDGLAPLVSSEHLIDNSVYVYAYVYIYMLWSYYLGQVWGFPKLLSGPSQCYYLGQVCFRTIKIGVSGDFFLLSYHFVFLFCVQLFANFLKIAFFEKRVQKLGFSIFSVLS